MAVFRLAVVVMEPIDISEIMVLVAYSNIV
jgi:hypothetical protein